MRKRLSALGKLLRLPNLLIIVLAVFIYSYNILYPAFAADVIAPVLRTKDFGLLLIILICTGAGGYIHNDILDKDTDEINEKRDVVGNSISTKLAWIYYVFVILSPLPFVYSLAVEINNLYWILAYLGVTALLFGYNQYFKRLPLIGNLIVAILCAAVVALPAVIEHQGLLTLRNVNLESYHYIIHVTLVFMIFTFSVHLIREVIKDAEDMKGDQALNFQTLPIITTTKTLTFFLISLEALLLCGTIYWIITSPFLGQLKLLHALLLIPLILWIMRETSFANESNEYHNISAHLKWLMFAGLFSLYIV